MTGTVRLRPATTADCEAVFAWANDPQTRAVSFSHDPIPWEGHVRWFDASLARDDRRLFIAEVEAAGVGIIRFDRIGEDWGQAEISINLAPEARGRGLGKATLAAATEAAEGLGVRIIVAYVRADNPASHRVFVAAGYVSVGEDASHGESASRYELTVKP